MHNDLINKSNYLSNENATTKVFCQFYKSIIGEITFSKENNFVSSVEDTIST